MTVTVAMAVRDCVLVAVESGELGTLSTGIYSAAVHVVWLARPSHLTARGAKGKGRSSGSND